MWEWPSQGRVHSDPRTLPLLLNPYPPPMPAQSLNHHLTDCVHPLHLQLHRHLLQPLPPLPVLRLVFPHPALPPVGHACTLAHTPAQVLARTTWEGEQRLGNSSPTPKTMAREGDGGWVQGLRSPRAADLEMGKIHSSLPGCWCWDSLSCRGTHTRPHPSARPPCTSAMLSSCCSSGCPLSPSPRASSLARKLTEIHLILPGPAQDHACNGLCV